MKKKIYFIGNVKAEFASRWKQEFSPESVARGRATAKTMALNKKGIATPITSLTAERFKGGIPKSQEVAAKGKQAMLAKATSSNRLTTASRGKNLKTNARPRVRLSTRQAQSFKQGAQNQAINKRKAFEAARADRIDKITGQGKYKKELTTPILNPFEQSPWEKTAKKGMKMQAPKNIEGRLNSISVKKPSLLSKIGGAIKRNPVASGAAIGAGVGALGYGVYKNMNNKNKR